MRRPILQTAAAMAAVTLLPAALAGCGQKGPLVPAGTPEASRSQRGRPAASPQAPADTAPKTVPAAGVPAIDTSTTTPTR